MSNESSIISFVKTKKAMYQVIAELIVDDVLTINQLATSNHIRDSIEAKHGFKIPSSPTTISKILTEQAMAKKEEIKKYLSSHLESNKLSIIFDEWTSRSNSRFVGILAVTKSKVFSLGMAKINGSANAQNIYEIISSKLGEFGIKMSDVVSMTTDGACVMKSFHSKTDCIGQLCILQRIHISVKKSFSSCNEIFDNGSLEDIDEEIPLEAVVNSNFSNYLI